MERDLEIAVIDDDESFRVALVESLASLGYQAEGYASGEDYVQLPEGRPVDCIVSDIHMPGMNGWDLMKRVAAKGRRIPFVLITGRSDKVFEAKAHAVGAICLLRKPFEISELVKCIERAVNE